MEKRNFRDQKRFHVKIDQNLTKIEEFKNHISPTPPCLLRLSMMIFDIKLQYIQNLAHGFWAFWRKSNLKFLALKLLYLNILLKLLHFYHTFEYVWIKFDEKGLPLHIGTP